jgi:HAD superfamily hydrolase (TIGR01450 family)
MADGLRITVDALIAQYDGFLLDAYGVLLHGAGPLEGGAAFLHKLDRAGKPYCIITNDASRSITNSVARYQGFGLPVNPTRLITSGYLLTEYFADNGLKGKRTIVLGTEDAVQYAAEAGGVIVPYDDESVEVVVAADDWGYPMLPTLNSVVTTLLRRLGRGEHTALVVPNPDLVYPKKDGFGITAGAIAVMIESILQLRDPAGVNTFVPLGKPHAPIYRAGMQRLALPQTARIAMVGDQLLTDVRGANDFGVDSVLILTGVSAVADIAKLGIKPKHVLENLLG